MSASKRPWLLIDVDGVLNPLMVTDDFELHELRPIGWTGPPLNVQLTPRHGEWINDLTDVFDLVWATTWEHSANKLIAPIVGLPSDLPVIPFAEPRSRHNWDVSFKTPSVARYVGSHPFVWLDDSITAADTAWFRNAPDVGPFLLLSIDPMVGLTEADCAAARVWAEGLS